MRLIKSLGFILLTLAGVAASAQTFEVDGINYNVLSVEEGTAEVTSGDYSGEVVIPAEVTYDGSTYSVTTIGSNAFFDCSALTSVEMPKATTIGSNAFFDCSALTSVSMPSVTTIGDWAFASCDALTSVDIPASCTFIGSYPFAGCTALKEIVVDENNPSYSSSDGALYNKNKNILISWPAAEGGINLPLSVTKIGVGAFQGCSALTSVSMPSVTTIGDGAFNSCRALASVFIPSSCTSIGANPFRGCVGLKEIVVDDNNPNYSSADGVLYDKGKTTLLSWPTAEGGINLPLSVTKIGVGAFDYCYALTSVDMSEVTTIGKYAFSECYALASVSMPSVTTIGDRAFYGCDALTSVEMPFVKTIGDYAFVSCSALTSIEMPKVTTIGDYAFNLCSDLTSVEMPEATTIGDYAFDFCDNLTSVEMPEVLTIGGGAFNYCEALTSVSMPMATTIGDYAFHWCSALTSVEMPAVTTIGEYAFDGCYALTSAEMPAVTTIGVGSFGGCSALTSVDIPASVTMIGEGAFTYCDALTSVYCHWEQPLECDPRFDEMVLTTATLYVPDGCVDAYRGVYPWSEFANIEEGGYSGIDDATAPEVVIKVIDGAITVEGGDGTVSAPVVEVYSAGGGCVYRGTDSSIGGLGHGVYVVKVGGTVHKVAL